MVVNQFLSSVAIKMHCRDSVVDSQATTLHQLVRDLLTNTYHPGAIQVDTDDPPSTMAKVALMMLAELFGEDMAQWDVRKVTPALWATLQAKMGVLGWRLVVASIEPVPGVTSDKSATIPSTHLWTTPGEATVDIHPDWPVYHLEPVGVYLAVHPNVPHQ